MVTEEEVVDIVEAFTKFPGLRVLDVSEKDTWVEGKDTFKSKGMQNACTPLRYREGFVPSVRIMRKNYL